MMVACAATPRHTHTPPQAGWGQAVVDERRAAYDAALYLPAVAYLPNALMPIAASSSIAFRTVI